MLKEILLNFFIYSDTNKKTYQYLGGEVNGFCYRRFSEFGVLVGVDDFTPEINESFSSVRIYSDYSIIEELQGKKVLYLSSTDEISRRSFELVCESFLDPRNREILLNNPIEWWKEWKRLMGNSQKNIEPYSFIGEMLVCYWLLKEQHQVSWNDKSVLSSVDIQTLDDFSWHEVKSTIRRYSKTVALSSQFQLTRTRGDTYLYYLQFEEVDNGPYSLKTCRNMLINQGYPKDKLDDKLKNFGFVPGKAVWSKAYQLNAISRYLVDENFPLIRNSDFVNGCLPSGVLQMTYTIDLSNLEFESITI